MPSDVGSSDHGRYTEHSYPKRERGWRAAGEADALWGDRMRPHMLMCGEAGEAGRRRRTLWGDHMRPCVRHMVRVKRNMLPSTA